MFAAIRNNAAVVTMAAGMVGMISVAGYAIAQVSGSAESGFYVPIVQILKPKAAPPLGLVTPRSENTLNGTLPNFDPRTLIAAIAANDMTLTSLPRFAPTTVTMDGSDGSDTVPVTEPDPDGEVSSVTVNPDDFRLTAAEAAQLVLAETPGTVTATKLVKRDGITAWKITLHRPDDSVVTGYVESVTGIIYEWVINKPAPDVPVGRAPSVQSAHSEEPVAPVQPHTAATTPATAPTSTLPQNPVTPVTPQAPASTTAQVSPVTPVAPPTTAPTSKPSEGTTRPEPRPSREDHSRDDSRDDSRDEHRDDDD